MNVIKKALVIVFLERTEIIICAMMTLTAVLQTYLHAIGIETGLSYIVEAFGVPWWFSVGVFWVAGIAVLILPGVYKIISLLPLLAYAFTLLLGFLLGDLPANSLLPVEYLFFGTAGLVSAMFSTLAISRHSEKLDQVIAINKRLEDQIKELYPIANKAKSDGNGDSGAAFGGVASEWNN